MHLPTSDPDVDEADTSGAEGDQAFLSGRSIVSQNWQTTRLQDRPGFLIRRLHQIHTALFIHECADEGLTPVQYSVLTALRQLGPCEQVVVSRAVGLDRTSTADVVLRLERRKLLRRRLSPEDRRMKITSLTEVGTALLKRIDAAAARAHARTLHPLDPKETKELMALMARIIDAHDSVPDG